MATTGKPEREFENVPEYQPVLIPEETPVAA